MQKIEIFQIDAFTNKIFHGNPAAVCLLNEWLNDELMQAIAIENNLSETAFVIKDNDNTFHIRWFTPKGEITLCGHATLAAGFALFELNKVSTQSIEFISLSGTLTVSKKNDHYILDFPRLNFHLCQTNELIASVVNQKAIGIFESDLDYLILLDDEKKVAQASVDFKVLIHLPKRGLIITAESEEFDFYSRCFYPKHNILEDPVTGSAHCVLGPFWAERLNKNILHAQQGLARRGEVFCDVQQSRVYISGHCRWFFKGQLVI